MSKGCVILRCNTVQPQDCITQHMTSRCNFTLHIYLSRKVISYHFHVDNDKSKSGIGYEMIIGHNLMLQLGLLAEFKRKVIQWDSVTVTTKEPTEITLCNIFQVEIGYLSNFWGR